MRSNCPCNRRGISLAVMIASTGLALPVIAQEEKVEEILVTGSFIRGTPQDAPSPVTVIDRASIQDQGASQIWDVIRNLEVNQGSDTSVAGSNDASQLQGTASVNLRNLGGNSTLTLINGKRFTPAAVTSSSGQEFVDLNTIPLVMTDRVEVLTDGGSALYGSDAVAGVVNIMMRTDFEGLELFADTQGIQESGGTYEQTFSAIWGTSFNDGDTRFVISGEHFERDPVQLRDSQYFEEGRTISNGRVGSFSPNSPLGAGFNPAYIDPALSAQQTQERLSIDESVSGTRGIVFSDPLCESLSGNFGEFFVDNRFTGIGRRSGQCSENNLDNQFIAIGQERTTLAGSFEHTFSDATEFYSFFNYSTLETAVEWDGSAFSRTQHLWLPNAALGSLAPFVGNVAPVDIPNNPNLVSNGGFGEGWFGSGVQTGWPRNNEDLITENTTSGVQLGLRGELDSLRINDAPIRYDVSLSWSDSSIEQEVATLVRDRTELAINGLGGPNCTPNGTPNLNFLALPNFNAVGGLFAEVFPGYVLNTRESYSQALTSSNHGQGGCMFFNPFLTSLANPSLANDPELWDWMTTRINRSDKRNQLLVFDAVASGEMFEMQGGKAQFAAGVQRRERRASGIAPEINLPGLTVINGYEPGLFGAPNSFQEGITNNLECASCIFNFEDTQNVNAVFLELSLPFVNNVETQIALRWEDYGGNIGSDIAPKIAMSWRPIESLLLRGSYSQSFRAPNIGVVNQAFEAFGTTVLDPLRNQEVRAGLLPATNENALSNSSFTSGSPNPNLGSETADTYNIGVQWTPSGSLDGLSISADVWRFKVSDRVLPLVPRAALNPQIDLFNTLVGDPSNYIENDSLPLDARGVDGNVISCDPNAVATQFGAGSDERLNCVVNPELYDTAGVERDPTNVDASLITLVLPAVNAGNIQVQGIDLSLGYSFSTDFGDFRFAVDYTHMDEYLVSDVPGLELGLQETGRFDAAGTDGEQNIVREAPDNRGNITMSWAKDNHRVTVFNRHTGSYEILGHQEFINNPNVNPIELGFARSKVDSYASWDVQYNFTHEWANSALGSAVFTVGVIDATDADIPLFRRQSFDASVFDARGRRWYARALWRL